MIPALIQWEITDRCNLRCPHCYHLNSQEKNKSYKELEEEEMWQIAEIIVNNHLFFVTFTGGEPLVRKRLLVELTKYLYDQGIILSLNTNLLLLEEKFLEELKIHRMLVSCPACTPEDYKIATGIGDYEQFKLKLKMLIASNINHTVNMVVSKMNLRLVRETAQQLAIFGVKRFAATPTSVNATKPDFSLLITPEEVKGVISDLIWIYENLGLEVDIMESIPKCLMPLKAFELGLPFIYRSCHAGKRNGTISAMGEVRPCSHNPLTFGNILREDIGIIWDKMFNWREHNSNFSQDCLNCDIFNYCGGGCRVDAKIRTGKADSPHPYMNTENEIPKIMPKEIILQLESVIRPTKSFQSRRENSQWLVAPGSPRDIITVDDQTYQFIVATRSLPPMTIKALAIKFKTQFENQEFQRVIRTLIKKKFFILEK